MHKTHNQTLKAIVISTLILISNTFATNPIITTAYTADPSGHVFNDTLYVYASHDRIEAKEWDMLDYHCYSTDDLKNWTDHGIIFSLENSPWGISHLWAPDCVYKDGKYYLYYPASETDKYSFKIGVAISDSPTGPFTDIGKPIPKVTGIDPSVFIDDDGQAYIYWANGGPKAAKLKNNMIELDGQIINIEGCEKFFEGPWVFKRNNIYYITYPAWMKGGSGDGGQGQYYDYAISKSPLGPFTYKGHFSVTHQQHAGNIHGSQFPFKDKWYCLYHDFSMSTDSPNRGFKRCVKLDEINFYNDDSIKDLIWTTNGPAKLKNLNPYIKIEAECLNQTDIPEGKHAVATQACSEGGVNVGWIDNGDWLRYANLDFSKGTESMELRIASPFDNAKLQIRLDSLDGQLIGTIDIPNTGGWQNWKTVKSKISPISDIHDIYLVAESTTGGININWFSFQLKNSKE